MYQSQSRPSRNKPAAQPPPPPGPVRSAVAAMYAGAAISILTGALGVATRGTVQDAIRRAHPQLTSPQVSAAGQSYLISILGLAVLGTFLWLFLARACVSGRNWGRVTGTVLFALNTVTLLGALALPEGAIAPPGTVGIILAGLLWLAGLVAVIMLWRRESTAFFTAPGNRL